MNRIDALFSRLKDTGETALVIYLTAGDPDIETTRDLLLTIQDAGADMIEVGVPFSDPMADGPTIQRASNRALDTGGHARTGSGYDSLDQGRSHRSDRAVRVLQPDTLLRPEEIRGVRCACGRRRRAGGRPAAGGEA